jgi:hypothetical protein
LTEAEKTDRFEVLSLDPNGKLACVSCRCGAAHIFGIEALLNGSATCAAMPLTRKQRVAHALKDAFNGRAYMPNGAAVPIKIMANNGKGWLR